MIEKGSSFFEVFEDKRLEVAGNAWLSGKSLDEVQLKFTFN